MEVPFEYLCFLALEKLLKYENKRKIKIEKLLKYISEIQKSFIKSFNNGEKATHEKGLKRNFKFKSFDSDEKLNDLISDFDSLVYIDDNNNLCLYDDVDYDTLLGIVYDFDVSSRFNLVALDDECRKILGIKEIMNTLKHYSLFERKLEEKYINLGLNSNKEQAKKDIKSFLLLRGLFFNKIKNLSELELACYDDESTEFDNNETKDYEEYPVDKNMWYKSMYYDSRDDKELDETVYDIFFYSLFSKNDLSALKLNKEISEIYDESLDVSDDIDYELNEYLEDIPDIDTDNFLDDSSYEINIDDRECDYLFYMTFIKKLDLFTNKYGTSNDLIIRRQRLLYSLDKIDLCLFEEDKFNNKLEELQEKAGDQTELVFYKKIIWFLTEEVFKREMNSDSIIKLLLISSYYEITKDERIEMLFNKNANNKYYDIYYNIVFTDEKTLSM